MEKNESTYAEERAQAYGLFSALFLNEPSDSLLQALSEQGAAQGESDENPWSICATWLADKSAQDGFEAAREDVWVDFANLFANASTDAIHPFESVYLGPDKLLMQPQRDEVVAAYLEESFAVDESYHLPEDHASFELAFLSELCAQEAQAQPDEAKRLRDVQAQFLFEHVLAWIPELCSDMQEHAHTAFYKAFALACTQFLNAEARYLEEEECDL